MPGVVDGIARSWRAPRAVMAAEMAAGLSESRALLHLVLACGVYFVASLPAALENPLLPPEEAVSAAVAAQLFAWGALAPLLGYGAAALVHLLARAFGGQGRFLAARAALFWSALAAAPAALALSLGGVLAGRRPWLDWLDYAALALWLWIFAASLAATEGFASTWRVAAVAASVLAAAAALVEFALRGGVR